MHVSQFILLLCWLSLASSLAMHAGEQVGALRPRPSIGRQESKPTTGRSFRRVHAAGQRLGSQSQTRARARLQVSRATSPSLSPRQTCPQHIHSEQKTTYYFAGTDPNQITACGARYDTAGMTTAITTLLADEIGGMANACGRSIVVVDAETGSRVQVTITDANVTLERGKYALDVTPTAYEALGGHTVGPDMGTRDITWYLVDEVQNCF